jgi:hypothetical protein
MKRKPHRKHWYKYYIGECPVCGRDQSYKERQYTPKPEHMHERIEYLPDTLTYDHCMG